MRKDIKIFRYISLAKFMPIVAFMMSPILSFLVLPIVTESIDPSQYGLYNYYISIINYILLFLFFPSINSCISRFLNVGFYEYEKDFYRILNLILISSIIYFAISSVLTFVFNDILYTYLSIAYYVINIFNFYKSYLNINGKKIKFSMLLILVTVFQYSVVLITYKKNILNVYYLLLGNVAISIVILIILIALKLNIIYNFKLNFKLTQYGKLIKFILPTLGISLAGIVLSSGDRLIIKNLLYNGDYYVGIYAVNYTLYAQVIDIIVSIINIYLPNKLYPIYEQQGVEHFMEGLEKFLKIYLYVATLIVILVGFNYRQINYILFNSKYIVNSNLSVYVILGQYFFGAFRIISNYYYVTNDTKTIAIILSFVSFLNIVLNILFINIFGYIAAAITTLICYIILFLLIHCFVKKHSAKNLMDKENLILMGVPFLLIFNNIYIDEQYVSKLDALLDIIINSGVIIVIFIFFYFKKIFKIIKKENIH